MIKKISSLVWPILLVLSLLSTPFAPVGPAAAETVWTDIATPAELAAIGQSANLAGSYRLVQHIDLAGYNNGDGKGWKPIGTNSAPFTGKLDGNGYTIRNMTINRPNDNLVGLFGSAENATLTNIRLTNVQVNGQQDVGAIVGQISYNPIPGPANIPTITKSYAAGSVTGYMRVGLLVGYNAGSNVSDSYAQGRVQIDGAGGSSYGGLIGYSTGNSNGKIDRSYSTAAVESGSYSGGLIGQKPGAAAITSSYWDTETSGLIASGGGTGKTTAEMKRKATYAGWDFDNTWGIVEESTYPLHRDDYLKIALAALTVQDASTLTAQALDRTFSGDYGVYKTKVINKTSQITVTGTPLSGTSTVSVNGGSGSETVALNPGQNTVQITVAEPGGLNATYTLNVFRDEGSALYPHRITTAGQLAEIGDSSEGYEMNHTYELEADIDLSGFGAGSGWQPIGNAATPFTGTFKGNGHTIANLTVNRPDTDHVGLFGYTSSGAAVSNIALLGAELHGQHYAGGLIGTANDTAISGISVQGAVYGDDGVGGLIGVGSGTLTIDESYSAAVVAGNTRTGGLIGSNTGGTVTKSFWDNETSGQASSAGGTGRMTQQMMQKSTFVDSGWQFGSGNRWGIIEGTTYPMPYDRFGSVLLSGMTITAPGTTVTLNRSFTDAHGLYTATLARPVAIAHISVTAADAAGTQVSINGIAGSSADIDLSLGNNPVDIRVTDANGIWQGVYRLTVAVPVPRPSAVEVPADGTYGIARHLDFTIAYNSPVDVTGTPELPVLINGIEKLALYTGKPAGQPEKLQFRYTVLSGDLDMDGIGLGNAIAAVPPATLTVLGDPVPLDLPASLPSLSGILIDGVQPSVTLTPSVTAPTSGTITVTVLADGTGSALAGLKWTAGVQDAVYFETAGTPVAGGTFPASLNGSYTVYAQDAAGNSAVKTIDIANIVTQAPTITIDYSPKTAVGTGVAISASASVFNAAAGNALTTLRWASGERTAADFAVPTFGTNVPPSGSFSVTANGKYTVYAADSAGLSAIQTIEISNIVTQAPTITIDYSPKTAVGTGVDISASASVFNAAAGNALTTLRWAPGDKTTADFAVPTFGTDVPPSGSFNVTANGKYTVYAADSSGLSAVQTIEISNIVTQAPTITIDYSPKTAVGTSVAISASASVFNAAAGNALTTLRWASGERTAADFAVPTFGTNVPPSGSFSVTANGKYTVYAADSAGLSAVQTIEITNIVTQAPTITIDYSPKTAVGTSVEISASASVFNSAGGNALAALRWASGERNAADFAVPTYGTDVPPSGSFNVTANGKYTVYAADSAGLFAVQTIEITNIVTQAPTITLDYSPKTAVSTGVEISASASVFNSAGGNALTTLRWASGERTAADFAVPTFGTNVPPSGSFSVTANGKYTVYAADSAGLSAVQTIEISNIVTQAPTITLDYSPKTAVSTSVAITVTTSVYNSASGNALTSLRWVPGDRTAADFAVPTFGTDVPPSDSFNVTVNGTYTVFALDAAGHSAVQTIEITNIVTQAPTIILDYSPKTAVSTSVAITVTTSVYNSASGNALTALRWVPGDRTAADFAVPTFGTDVPPSGSFNVTANGTYTVFALDAAGHSAVQTIEITNIVTQAPTIILDYSPKTAVSTSVAITVTTSVYNSASGNALTSLRWVPGDRTAADFAVPTFGTDVPPSDSFNVTVNGTYTVFALDAAGHSAVQTIEITNIVTQAPTIILDYSPKTAVSTSVAITVTTSVYHSAGGNALTVLRWAPGERTTADFAVPTFGTNVPSSGSFSVTANGKYTVYAADSAGLSAVRTIEITNIVNTPPTQQPTDLDTEAGPFPISDSSKFSIEPGKAYTLTFAGLTLHIPAGAIERPTIITVGNLKNQIQHLLRPDQSLLSDVFELTKDVIGKFNMPIRLSLEWSDGKLGADQRAVLAYYDEAAAEWIVIGDTIDGNLLSGETDHFTKFAVLALAAPPEPDLTDIAGHWAETAIREGVAKGVLEGYPDGTFRPDRPVSRAEFVLLLQRIMAWPNGERLSFRDERDIPSWAADAVAAAVRARAISGYPDDTFRPNANINRTEMAVLIAKAAGLRVSEAQEVAFADADAIAGWSRPFIGAAYEAGLIQGQSGNLFQPLASATRAEAVVLLLRMAAYMQTPDT